MLFISLSLFYPSTYRYANYSFLSSTKEVATLDFISDIVLCSKANLTKSSSDTNRRKIVCSVVTDSVMWVSLRELEIPYHLMHLLTSLYT